MTPPPAPRPARGPLPVPGHAKGGPPSGLPALRTSSRPYAAFALLALRTSSRPYAAFALLAYMSTYSWPESRITSVITESVTARRT